jgi:hypothetical protein
MGLQKQSFADILSTLWSNTSKNGIGIWTNSGGAGTYSYYGSLLNANADGVKFPEINDEGSNGNYSAETRYGRSNDLYSNFWKKDFWNSDFTKRLLNFVGFKYHGGNSSGSAYFTWERNGWDGGSNWNNLSFDNLWENYPSSSILHIDPSTGKDVFEDHCAINVSEALEKSGINLKLLGGTKCWNCSGSGNHLIRAQELADAISLNIKPVKLKGENFESYVKGRTGIIFFQDYWQRNNQIGRTGDHIDLWNKNELASVGFFLSWLRLTFPETSENFLDMSDLRISKSVWFWEIK